MFIKIYFIVEKNKQKTKEVSEKYLTIFLWGKNNQKNYPYWKVTTEKRKPSWIWNITVVFSNEVKLFKNSKVWRNYPGRFAKITIYDICFLTLHFPVDNLTI